MQNITATHIERGTQMRQIVQHDITERGLSFKAAVESLAQYLGIESEAVKLGIAIANEEQLRIHNASVSAHYAALR